MHVTNQHFTNSHHNSRNFWKVSFWVHDCIVWACIALTPTFSPEQKDLLRSPMGYREPIRPVALKCLELQHWCEICSYTSQCWDPLGCISLPSLSLSLSLRSSTTVFSLLRILLFSSLLFFFSIMHSLFFSILLLFSSLWCVLMPPRSAGATWGAFAAGFWGLSWAPFGCYWGTGSLREAMGNHDLIDLKKKKISNSDLIIDNILSAVGIMTHDDSLKRYREKLKIEIMIQIDSKPLGAVENLICGCCRSYKNPRKKEFSRSNFTLDLSSIKKIPKRFHLISSSTILIYYPHLSSSKLAQQNFDSNSPTARFSSQAATSCPWLTPVRATDRSCANYGDHVDWNTSGRPWSVHGIRRPQHKLCPPGVRTSQRNVQTRSMG